MYHSRGHSAQSDLSLVLKDSVVHVHSFMQCVGVAVY